MKIKAPMKVSKETMRSAPNVFVLYMLASALVILVFRFALPGEDPPLPLFSRNWRFIRGLLELFNLFPALAFSALLVPFGMVSYEKYHSGFSPRFFKRLMSPVITAICAAAVYGLVFFLAFPMAHNVETNMRFKGELYRMAKERARTHSGAGEWNEAAQFMGVCDRVWPDSPELASLKSEIAVRLDELRSDEAKERAAARAALLAAGGQSAGLSGLPGQRQPVDAAEAVALGEAAFSDRRYFDAHWFATLGQRLAKEGSPEAARSLRLAGRAWNQIESLSPTRQQEKQYSLYNLKRSGYQSMNSGDWITAYYIFKELIELAPDDPDALNFFALSEKGTKETAFFIDEVGISLGEIITGIVFSLPGGGEDGGRAVLRFASLSASADYAYGMGLEYLGFNAQSKPQTSLMAPYAKLLPLTLDGKNQVLVLMRALDRSDSKQRWEPQWIFGSPTGKSGTDAQVILNISFEDLLLITQVRQGIGNLQVGDLFEAAKKLGQAGFVPEVFEADMLNRLGTVLFFLPMSVFVIIIGWRLRARSRPRYFFVLLLPVLPIAFNSVSYLYRSVLNTAGIWLVLTLGFSAAFTIFIAALVVLFLLSLILLAAQHG